MLEELTVVLAHQQRATLLLERRLRELELVAGAGEHRFTALARDAVEEAYERVAALELTRVLGLVAAGRDPTAPARELLEHGGDDAHDAWSAAVVDGLRQGAAAAEIARQRARDVVAAAAGRVDERRAAADALAQA